MSPEESFAFDSMTPELQSYLEHQETYSERYEKDEEKEWRGSPEQASGSSASFPLRV